MGLFLLSSRFGPWTMLALEADAREFALCAETRAFSGQIHGIPRLAA
jgi:hypothetical protein